MDDNIEEDFNDVMRTTQGRKVLTWVLDRTGIDKCAFNGQSNHTIFNEGRKSVGFDVVTMLKNADKDLYLKMIEEKLHE